MEKKFEKNNQIGKLILMSKGRKKLTKSTEKRKNGIRRNEVCLLDDCPM